MSPAFSPAAERNRQAILEVLGGWLGPQATVLEIASGTGQHAAHFAAAQPGWRWQPSDADPQSLVDIDERCAGLPNVAPALRLDVMAPEWRGTPASFDAAYCANMLHIAPWPACPALLRGVARQLKPGGLLVLYGPYFVDDAPTAASNLRFDADLRSRDPRWGLRRLGDVVEQAANASLRLEQRVAMPANNLLLAFRRTADGGVA
ncbi:MAG: class I SAM-dependent methyltransferase [Pseudomonadota bacterium]|nr:class I SAM-dependent methyltransferase [Pseudomonadota bacterium]